MKTKYMNPYLAGFFLGLVLLATIFITGRGLGASGAIKSVVVATVDGVAPKHAESSSFYGTYVGPGKDNPLKSWLVFEVIGVVIGGFISGLISDRLKIVTESGPKVEPQCSLALCGNWRRIVRDRCAICPRLHKRRSVERNGCSLNSRICNDDGNFRNRICRCILRP